MARTPARYAGASGSSSGMSVSSRSNSTARSMIGGMTYHAVRPGDYEWITRPHAPGEPARHVAELSDLGGFGHVRGTLWRYEPGAKRRRHRHPVQEETFVPLSGTLTMYLG